MTSFKLHVWRLSYFDNNSRLLIYTSDIMSDDESQPELDWEDEAAAVIKDIENLTKAAQISSLLVSNKQNIYINITTLEDKEFCIELSSTGFRIAGFAHDKVDNDEEKFYETPYSLLADISPSYHKQFAQNLIMKLESLNK